MSGQAAALADQRGGYLPPPEDDRLLNGAREIAKELRITRDQALYWLSSGKIKCAWKLEKGGKWFAYRNALRAEQENWSRQR